MGPSAEHHRAGALGVRALGSRAAAPVPRRGQPAHQRRRAAARSAHRADAGTGPRRRGALLAAGGGVLRLPPAADTLPVVLAAAALGPMLVVVPSVDGRGSAGGPAAPCRAHAWRRCPRSGRPRPAGSTSSSGPAPRRGRRAADVAAIVVLDEHDEALQEERSPTWHARDVRVERARRAGVPALLVSPCPSVNGAGRRPGRAVQRPSVDEERAGWPIVEIVDRSRDEPWKTSLVTSPLIRHLRSERTVVCVHNTTGRARLLACRTCRTLDALRGVRGRRGARRRRHVRLPPVRHRAAGGVPALRGVGVRQPAAGRDAPARGARGGGRAPGRGGHRSTTTTRRRRPASTSAPRRCCTACRRADVVAFLDLDAELLAPRYRAAEQAMTLLVRAARLVGGRERRRAAAGADVPARATRCSQAALHRRPRTAGRAGAGPPPAARASRRRRAGRDQRRRQRGGGDRAGRRRRCRRRRRRRPLDCLRRDLGAPRRRDRDPPPEGLPPPRSRSTRPASDRPDPDGSRVFAIECHVRKPRTDLRCRRTLGWRRSALRIGSPWRTPSGSVGKPCSISQRCRESAPRCFCTTSIASPSGARRGSHCSSSSCSAGLPMRIGGLLQIASNRTSAGTSSGATRRTLVDPVGRRRWRRTARGPAR